MYKLNLTRHYEINMNQVFHISEDGSEIELFETLRVLKEKR